MTFSKEDHMSVTFLPKLTVLIAFIHFGLVGVLAQQPQGQPATTQAGPPTVNTEVRSGEVVYVTGNDLVVKMSDGQVKHFTVPESARFTVDGNQVSVHELKPGTKLTQTITTTTTPQNVTTVRKVSGTVWQVMPPRKLIVTLADGTNKEYDVPSGMKFEVAGEQKTIFDLSKGMKLSATVVTTTPQQMVSSTQSVTGQAPAQGLASAPPPALPPAREVSSLLIEEQAAPSPAPAAARPQTSQTPASAPARQQPARLPQTASSVHAFALLGASFLFAAMALRLRRRF
jgi:hypothetical protein